MKHPKHLTHRVLTLVLAAVLSMATAAHANDIGPAPPVPQTPEVLDCATSPFGSVLTLREENEAFISFRGGVATNATDIVHHDRFDLNSGGVLSRSASIVGSISEMQGVSELVSVMADLDGSGTSELVQAFTKSGNDFRIASLNSNGVSDLYTDTNHKTPNKISIAAGHIITNTNKTPRQQLVVASAYGAGNSLRVFLVAGDTTGGLMNSGLPIAAFYSDTLQNISQTSIAVGDLDGDGVQNDIVVAVIVPARNAKLLTLHFDYDTYTFSQTGFMDMNIGGVNNVRVAIGNIDADYKDEIVLATDTYQQDQEPLSSQLKLFTFDLVDNTPNAPGGEEIVRRATWQRSANTTELALDVGDTDGDGLGEIALGYRYYGSPSALIVNTFDVIGTSVISNHNIFSGTTDGREAVQFLDLKAGDMNNDGSADIVVGFRDSGSQVQALHLTDVFTPALGLQIKDFKREAAGGHINATNISVALGDWNDDSMRAHQAKPSGSTIQCKTVEEPNIVAAVYAPPYWDRLQGEQAASPRSRRAWIGQSKGGAQSQETAMKVSRNHSVTGYVGLKVGGEALGASFEAEAKLTAGYEWNAANTRRSGTGTKTTTEESWKSNEGSFIALERTTNDCFNYQLRQGNTDIDAVFRFCEQKGYAEVATDLDNWDSIYGPAQNAQALQWAPMGRDWANTALFRSGSAAQSSTEGDAVAARAADGDTTGTLSKNSVARTLSETTTAPWWQIDLGEMQELRAVRVWNRDNIGCTITTTKCNAALKDFYVFVSDVDFRTISNDPAVLKESPLVWTKFYTGSAGNVVNIQTFEGNEPVIGRYVRVQLANPGALALAEVQAFGANTVDPDRYPIAVTDPITNDGWFNAIVVDPDGKKQTVRVRGNLLWNGANYGVLQSKRVTVGNVEAEWSLEEERERSNVESHELENVLKVGAEFDVEGGFGAKLTAGGGYEFATGLLTEAVRSTSWLTGFVIGGGVQGLPTSVDGVTLHSECEYGFQPYYYEVTDESSTGYKHRYIVVDYIVPEQSITRSTLDICRAKLRTPVMESQTQTGAPGSLFVMTAQGFPTNADVMLELKGPNDADFIKLTTLKMNGNGSLVFVLKTQVSDPVGNYSVRLSVNANGNQANAPRAATATTSIALNASAPPLNTTPVGATTVSTKPGENKKFVYLPLLSK